MARPTAVPKVCRTIRNTCAKVRLFNTTVKRFRAGLVVGKLLIWVKKVDGLKSSDSE